MRSDNIRLQLERISSQAFRMHTLEEEVHVVIGGGGGGDDGVMLVMGISTFIVKDCGGVRRRSTGCWRLTGESFKNPLILLSSLRLLQNIQAGLSWIPDCGAIKRECRKDG